MQVTDEATSSELLIEFTRRAEPLGVRVVRTADAESAAAALAGWASELEAAEIVVAREVRARFSEVLSHLESGGVRVAAPGPPEQMRDAPLGLGLGHLAVAETGSVLMAEPDLADRTAGLLSLAQAVICPTSALVASLDDAAPLLRRFALARSGSMTTLVTGPSRTADIERVLTVGVQGPGRIMVLFVDELGSEGCNRVTASC
jgi:L-lactate dehydrogenase complex protein LldG